ncbi:MAG: cation transporter [Clostridia bacterium]|nr:cation transporter [Clostridia bacterium]
MTELIKKLFVKDHENTESPIVRARYGAVAGAVGIVTNLLLAAAKMTIGFLFGAISVVADGINNLTDSLSSIITLVGFRMSAAQADEDHPYGHGRMEYIAAMLIAMLMAVVGFSLAEESFPKIFEPEYLTITPILIITLVISIGVKLWQGLFYRKMGKAIESDTLRANFRDSINDVVSTTAVLLSIAITPLIGYNTDGVMGVAVALFIMYSGIMLMKDTINLLLGEGADSELAQKIGDAVMEYDGIIGVHDLEVHNYGPGRIFASVHAEVPAEVDVLVSHDIIDNVERELRERLGLHLTIHLDPVVTNDPLLDALRLELKEIVGTFERVSFHDLRIVRGTTHTNVLFDLVVPFGYELSDKELCRRVEADIRNCHPDFYAVITVDKDLVKNSQKH